MTTKNIPAEEVVEPVSVAMMLEVIREELEITKVEMSEKLEVSKQQYNNIVNSDAPVSLSRAIRFAQLLGDSEKLFMKVAIQDELARARRSDYRVEIIAPAAEF